MFDFFRKKAKKEEKSFKYDDFVSLFSPAAISASGEPITPMRSLECATVLACVRLLANGIAQVPFRLFKQKRDIRNPAVDHPLYDLLYAAPNDFQTAFEFWHMVMMHLCLTGNAFVWVNRATDGRVLELLP